MNACEKNKKSIAWLALGALDAREETALRAHLVGCEGCRKYFAEVSGVTAKLETAAPESAESDIQAPAHFHRQLMERLRAGKSSSAWDELFAGLGRVLNWRVAVSAMAVVTIALLVVVRRQPDAMMSYVTPPVVPVLVPTVTDPAPTMANYQMAASQSLSKLDDLLTKQGNEGLPPAPLYTASTKLPDNSF